ncbi:SseB family protein [Campylobacter sp. faydin G-24]|uniref:SseB family protein n=1 Tax=Campylobacter anatolicus TaxID=2829105 RepID=A0ABS5HGN4_9BACT|nr:SseB family protein [Campylobacter anatolicus]MBR8463413.1 SseB family protein [Campylobacter anatolicus]MBR8465234.1 SseB family protein [Campylobacter anatolicus]
MKLKEMMARFNTSPSAANEKALLDELLKAEFLAPILFAAPLAKPDGGAVYEEEGSNIKFVILQDEQDGGDGYFPAFTSRDELQKWRNDSEAEVLNLRLKDYAAILFVPENKYQGVVIDAFSDNLMLDIKFFKAIFKR